jgi:hypothetical protein
MRSLLPVLLVSLFALPLHAESADLQMFTEPVGLNQFTFSVRVVNYGPDIARNITFFIDAPPQLEVEKVLDANKPCDTTQKPVKCETGKDLGIGIPTTGFEIVLKQPAFENAKYDVTITVASDVPDPNPEFNTRTVTIDTRIVADLNVIVEPGFARVDPGAAQMFRTQVTNYFETIPAEDIRIDYTVTHGTLESIEPPDGVTCNITSDTTALCTAPRLFANCRCIDPINVRVRVANDRNGGNATLTVHAMSNLEEYYDGNDQAAGVTQIYRWIPVTTTADDGAGSLRDAIARANAECGAAPCKIAFEIDAPVPSEGYFTLTPASPLPAITADRVVLSGATQKDVTGDTNPRGPEIAIDGHLAHRGLEAKSRCESVIEGLALGNFDTNQALWFTEPSLCDVTTGPYDLRVVQNNFIGVDPTGEHAWPNLRGLRADGARGSVYANVISNNTYSGVWMWQGNLTLNNNTINHNGASGIFLGPLASADIGANTIANNAQMGVAVARADTYVDIRQNSMRDNGGLGIDFGLDGISPVDGDDKGAPSNAPVLTSAVYRDGRTYFTFTLKTEPLGPYFNSYQLDFYANDAPDGDGEHWIGTGWNDGSFTTFVPGDYRGKWINATSTRTYFIFAKPPDVTSDSIAGGFASTSELSNAVLVQ